VLRRNHVLVDSSQKPFYLMGMIQKWLALILDLIIMVLAVLVVGIAVGLRDTISPGFTGVALTQIISFTKDLTTMILFWAQMETSISAVSRIRAFNEGTEQEGLAELERRTSSGVQDVWPAPGRVEIRDLTARYG